MDEKELPDISPSDEREREEIASINKWRVGTPSAADAFLDAVELAHPGEGLKESILRAEKTIQFPVKRRKD